MDLVVSKTAGLKGEVEVPPSKLHTQFATCLAMLANGKSTIDHPLSVRDTLVLLRVAELSGATVKRSPKQWSIWGTGFLKPQGNVVDVKNSGTAAGLMAAAVALTPRVTVLTGDTQLRGRPMPSLLAALKRLGVRIHSTKPDGSPPFVIYGGKLKGGKIRLKRDESAHLLPVLLPSPYARKRVELAFEEKPALHQLALARELMDEAGVEIKISRRVVVPSGAYSAFEVEIPPDLAAVAPHIAAVLLCGSKLKVIGGARTSGRGKEMLNILEAFGAKFRTSGEDLVVEGPQRLEGTRVSLRHLPELLPVLAVLACGAKGKTSFTDAAQAKAMKSDRISATAQGLKRLGARVAERRDGLVVRGQAALKGNEVDGASDYAVVAAMLVAGLLAEGRTMVRNGAEALWTSYPRFVSSMQMIGAEVVYLHKS